MKIVDNCVVTVSYMVTDEEDKVVGRTDPDRPAMALMGKHYFVPGLEKALYDHEKGDEFVLTLAPEEAFGEVNQGLIQTLDRAMFGNFPVAVDNVFEADTSAGPQLVRVVEVTDNTVTVDGNHPLAGKTLKFFVTVDDVREATPEEIEHGHAHRDGKCSFADPYGEEAEHQCCCGRHHHDGEDGEHHCGCGHHHHHDGEEGEGGDHHCCCGHHHDGAEGEEGEHHCGCGHHHHHHDGEDGEHHCGCGHHHHHHHHHHDDDAEKKD